MSTNLQAIKEAMGEPSFGEYEWDEKIEKIYKLLPKIIAELEAYERFVEAVKQIDVKELPTNYGRYMRKILKNPMPLSYISGNEQDVILSTPPQLETIEIDVKAHNIVAFQIRSQRDTALTTLESELKKI